MTDPTDPIAHATPPAGPPPAAPAMQFAGFTMPFLLRTARSTLITLGLVGAMAAVYLQNFTWAGLYVFCAVAALVFFGLTPLIVKSMLVDRRMLTGALLILMKIAWLGVIFAVLNYWTGLLDDVPRVQTGSAMIAGITTPLIVLVLRALGRPGGAGQAENGRDKPTRRGAESSV